MSGREWAIGDRVVVGPNDVGCPEGEATLKQGSAIGYWFLDTGHMAHESTFTLVNDPLRSLVDAAPPSLTVAAREYAAACRALSQAHDALLAAARRANCDTPTP